MAKHGREQSAVHHVVCLTLIFNSLNVSLFISENPLVHSVLVFLLALFSFAAEGTFGVVCLVRFWPIKLLLLSLI